MLGGRVAASSRWFGRPVQTPCIIPALATDLAAASAVAAVGAGQQQLLWLVLECLSPHRLHRVWTNTASHVLKAAFLASSRPGVTLCLADIRQHSSKRPAETPCILPHTPQISTAPAAARQFAGQGSKPPQTAPAGENFASDAYTHSQTKSAS